MLTHPTLDQLHALGLHGMAKGFKELDANPEARTREHPEWLALLLEHEPHGSLAHLCRVPALSSHCSNPLKVRSLRENRGGSKQLWRHELYS